LKKLGRDREAEAQLSQFRSQFLPAPPPGPRTPDSLDGIALELLDPAGLPASLLVAAYQAEVFLSVDAVADAEMFFRDEVHSAASDAQRLARHLVLGQILLLSGKRDEYATLTAGTIGPLLTKTLKARRPEDVVTEPVASVVGMLALMPLASREFLRERSEDTLRRLLPGLEDLRAQTGASLGDAPGVVLHALYGRLGMEKERRELAGTLWPTRDSHLIDEDVDRGLDELRSTMSRRDGWRIWGATGQRGQKN
jgi:hypothetical protein